MEDVHVAGGDALQHRLEDRLQLWDVESGKPSPVAWPVKNNFLPNCARLSPDGRFLACGGGGGQGLTPGFFVLDMTAHKPVVDLKLDKSVSACCFATKSALVALGDFYRRALVGADPEDGKRPPVISPAEGPASAE